MRLPLALAALVSLSACGAEGSDSSVATASSTVTVAYEGRLEDGRVFDASAGATFPLAQTVPGFRDGIAGMAEGETKTFTIAPADGYGPSPPPGSIIPPNAPLVFEVTLIDVE